MPRATVATTNPEEVEIEYDTFGLPENPPLLLVMGFTAQMTAWDDELCELLAAGGRYVIRFDNRDCGLSTRLDGQRANPAAVMTAVLAGDPVPEVPYTLSDMSNDAIGLLDALGIERAHIVGASMGGMIVQTMAIEHPERVASLVSIMSSPGDPRVGKPTPEAREVLLTPPPTEREAYIANSERQAVYSSKRYFDPARTRARAAASYDRAFYPEGATRQLSAIYASGDRSEGLAALDVPTLVIHGVDDALITPEGGERTAALIPGAQLLMVDDMGHDWPRELWPTLVDAILRHTDRA